MPAQRAAVGPQDPVQGLFHDVANADASKINRFAMRAAHGKHRFASFLTVSFRRAAGTLNVGIAEGGRRVPYVIVAAAASGGAAGFAGCLNLFGGSQVGFRKLHVLFRTGNLALVSFC
jgi:hypothetical protein